MKGKFKNFNAKGMEGLLSIFSDRNNPVFCCEKCHKYFGFFYYSVRMLSYFKSFDQTNGKTEYLFTINCRNCNHMNLREKIK